MKLWLVLILLSIVTYPIVQRSVSNITKTPVWLCWLVMMFPAFLWTAWTSYFGDERPIPLLLLLIPLFACPLIYGWLIQMGKSTPEKSQVSKEDSPASKPNTAASPPLRPINNEEETTLRNCFPWNIYYLQHIDYRPQAILCRGKLKTIPEEAYDKIKDNVEGAFGDRFFLIFQESFKGQPFFALVPNPQAKGEENKRDFDPVTRPVVALSLLLMTALTTTIAGIEMEGFTLEQVQSQPDILTQGLFYSIPLLIIILIHEFGHYFTTLSYQIRCTLPYVIPIPFFLGTLGAFVQRRSPIPHRRALFDIAIAGPIAGFIVTLPVLFWGLTQSQIVSLEESNLFNFEAIDPRLSFFFALMAKLALGTTLEPGRAIDLHPVAIAGYIGLLITALNLMPVGQLDGGHIVHAVFGQKMGVAIGQIARIVAILFALVHPSFWLWTIILWFMPLLDQPALNDITELDNWRDFCGLLVLGLLLLILLPLPMPVANLLNI
ncbi:Peptidase M50 [Hyella patelloides LEGE 07179]|uniref:Peptidase M50 n=1 Tax=Hyella patelloides LEGE 07179 TaxID=945734 RepID=A0A563W477_9CYAN|nr:site-2 protease family protein [Hyella patelloides]VEP18450.1 Peptidase M50 [Hyella patelloides LEGE 07179]